MRYLLLACAAAVIISSCNKEQTKDVPKTRTQMLYGSNTTSGAEAQPSKWKTKEFRVYVKKDDGTDTLYSDLYTDCKEDDQIQFFENFTGLHLTSDNKCSTNENDQYHFRWELSDNENKMNFYDCDRLFDYRTFIVKIKDFSESSFTLEYPEIMMINSVLDTVRIEHQFEKQ